MRFTCPHCGTPQIITAGAHARFEDFSSPGKFRDEGELEWSTIRTAASIARCANPDCSKLTIELTIGGFRRSQLGAEDGAPLVNQQIYPRPAGKPFPASVPAPMLQDYREAWSIIDLSPKSSATLARRCLQAMIRDFCGIRERTLFHEIEKLEQLAQAGTMPRGVEPETIAAMRVVKDVGNIGAHLTEVAGQIVDVDPDEAERLLGLIEMLFTDWYVARSKRRQQLAAIEAMAPPKG